MEIREYLSHINLGCHGIPERCLVVRGRRMKICARCFGSTIGHVVAFILMFFNMLPVWYISLGLILVMFTDWSLQQFFHVMSDNARRLITGLMGGLGVGSLIWTFVLLSAKYILKMIS